MRSNRIPLFKTQSTTKKKKGAILNHLGLEIIIAFLIAFLLVIIIKSKADNYIMNIVFAPLFGVIISLCIDNWVLIPKEAETMFKKAQNSSSPITTSLSEMVDVVDIIDQNIIESDDFRPIVAKSINHIKKVQEEHEVKIDKISCKCDNTIELLQNLQESERNDKKILLKKAMYDCLAKGFITPEERDKIELEYYSYTELLGGNSDVQDLHDNHFKKLSVHNERRKEEVEVEVDRRVEKHCEYGEFDERTD